MSPFARQITSVAVYVLSDACSGEPDDRVVDHPDYQGPNVVVLEPVLLEESDQFAGRRHARRELSGFPITSRNGCFDSDATVQLFGPTDAPGPVLANHRAQTAQTATGGVAGNSTASRVIGMPTGPWASGGGPTHPAARFRS